jgi:hypothetical protein
MILESLTGKMDTAGMPKQETPEGRAYKALMSHLRKAIARGNFTKETVTLDMDRDKELSEIAEQNEQLLELKQIAPGAVHYNEVLRTMSVMYQNDDFIATRAMPLVMTNGALSGVYFTYTKRDKFAYPDDDMTDRSEANELNQNRGKQAYGLTLRGLKEYLDYATIQNQSAPLNELIDLHENCLYAMDFRRELRVAAAVMTAGNYSGNTVALTGADRWNATTATEVDADSNPGQDVDTGQAAMWPGAGPGKKIGVTSLAVHNVLKRHPKILKHSSVGHNAGGPKFATRQMIAEYLELDEYYVGASRKDTANEGQTAAYSRIWSDSFAIIRAASPSLRNAGFGFVLQDAPSTNQTFWMPEKGWKGAYMQKCARADQELIVAGDTSYLITTPIG